MKQDRNWTDGMRDALREAEATPPAGGWERIERELAAQAAAAPRTIPLRRRLRVAAAAAAVVALVVAGDVLWHPGRVPAETEKRIASQTELAVGPAAEPVSEPIGERLAAATERGAGRQEPARVASAARSSLPSRSRLSAEPVAPHSDREAAAEKDAETRPETVSDGARTFDSARTSDGAGTGDDAGSTRAHSAARNASEKQERAARTYYAEERFVAHAPVRKKTALGLFAGGGVTGGNGISGGVTRTFAMNSPALEIEGTLLAPRNDYAESSFRHHQPLSFGLSLRKEFAYGLSLESGVVYTLLHSDVTRYRGTDLNQKLHMLGVPLRLNWQFFERGRFSLYIGAGGMVEKCVSARLGSMKMDESGVQWSLAAAAGAQYRLGGLVGLYFEPEGSYYLTRTRLETARTESPLTFTLRLGVRLSF